MSSTTERKLVPAQLGFLAIYNPSLGATDETVENQIVYYTSQTDLQRGSTRGWDTKEAHNAAHEQKNLQLRQIGLAQGMVEFGRTFSDGRSVDTVETEKSRIILHELESGWWILASINLTVLPHTTKTVTGKGKELEEKYSVEYSSREVKPAILLLGDLLQAHSTFLLHHASSLSALFVRTKRSKFIGLLGRYWDTYVSTWNVLMHGNPANSLYGGIKIAACGELGMGVGEEERGSGEREVLEGFVGRIDGLVDVVVAKFGDALPGVVEEGEGKGNSTDQHQLSAPTNWLGTGSEPAAEDGAIFLGTGALSRKSVRDVCHWMIDLYRWGPYAYGVVDNPSSNRRIKKGKSKQRRGPTRLSPEPKNNANIVQESKSDEAPPNTISSGSTSMTTIPPSPVAEVSSDKSPTRARRPSFPKGPGSSTSTDSEPSRGKRFVQFLKLGYGTHWTLGNPTEEDERPKPVVEARIMNTPPSLFPVVDSRPTSSVGPSEPSAYQGNDSGGHFLIGLMGDIEDDSGSPSEPGLDESSKDNTRVLLRTLTVELERAEDAREEADISIDLGNADNRPPSSQNAHSEHTTGSGTSFDGQDRNKTKKLQVVVYVNKPFIFVFLFELRTDSLAFTSLYRSLHYQLGPLIKPLLNSTSFRASRPDLSPDTKDSTPIYDLVWDPKLLTVNSTIPNIPDPIAVQFQPPESFPWSRIEALNTHMQVLNTYIATATDRNQLERTCKTSRGWWIVWTRIPEAISLPNTPSSGQVRIPQLIAEDSNETQHSAEFPPSHQSTVPPSMRSGPAHPFLEAELKSTAERIVPKDKEIFLIRRASDYAGSGKLFVSGSSLMGGEHDGPGKLAQGIGVDTKRYIKSLLNLAR